DCLFPGERLSNVSLHLPKRQVEVEGAICNNRKKGEGFQCGFEIQRFKNDSQEFRWKKYVLESTYRRLRLAGSEDASTVWAVLESSKYTDLVAPDLRGRLKRHFFKTWKKHAENPRAFIAMNLFENDKPVGTCAANLVYPKTFLGHHLSIDRGIKKNVFDISREICSGMSFVLHHMVFSDYFICYADAFKNLARTFYGQFVHTYPAHEDFIYDRHHVYKGRPDCQTGDQPTRKGAIRVVPANGVLLDQLADYFKKNVSDLEIKAFSYERDNLTLECFSEACRECRYEMTREIFFAVENETPLAALVAETGDEAMNLFSLLNFCRIIFLRPESKDDDRIYEVLFHKAMNHYLSRKKPEFIFYMEYDEENKKTFDRFGLKYVTDVMRFVGRTNILSAHLNYLDENLGIRHHRLNLR
ncbi:MAG: hypothetical protein JRJ85_15130, partial [Deltaproteobacteria bacterium]|nr:hypothetical protein [Deltaproteobacteria bacterium]